MKQQILNDLNEIIVNEKGKAVTINSMFTDSELDSLGIMLAIAMIEIKYPIFKDIPDKTMSSDAVQDLDIPNLTIRDLIKKCILSITPTDTEPKNEMAT